MKKVLVIYYTQSGQLLEIAKNVTRNLNDSEEVDLSFYEIKLKNDFPFPWDRKYFYNIFPETFLQVPRELDDLDNPVLKKSYDLIIFSYQVWYLTPAIPANSFLKADISKQLFQNTPVITLIGARNMWIMAQEKVKKLLVENKAKLVGNIALVDRHINHISVITIIHWMFTGVKKRLLGIFPKPGVSEKDIDESVKFSEIILKNLMDGKYEVLQKKLLEKDAVRIKPFLIVMDKRANFLFGKWSKLIFTKGAANSKERRPWIKMFNIYLIFAIWIIAPVVFLLFLLTFLPRMGKIKNDKVYYSSIDLK